MIAKALRLMIIISTAFLLGLLSCHYKTPPYSTIIYFKNKISNSMPPSEFYIRNKLDTFNKLSESSDVVFIGDSITDWMDWGDAFRDNKIVNFGIAGNTISNMSSYSQMVYNTGAKKAFIMGGINDLMIKKASSEVVFDDYKKTITALSEKGIQVVVQSTLLTRKSDSLNIKVSNLNNNLSEYCNNTKKCLFVDLNKHLSRDGRLDAKYTFDGVHLNGDGYLVWVKLLRSDGLLL